MTNHPGDPRSDALGKIPFDPNEYPNQHFVPTAVPPNVGVDYIPHRGQSFHGVGPSTVPQEFSDLSLEQAAHDQAAAGGPEIKDPQALNPVPVTIIESPNLTQEVLDRFSSYRVSQSVDQVIQLINYNQQRNKVTVKVSTVTAICQLLISSDAYPTVLNSMVFYVTPNQTDSILYESIHQGPLYCKVVSATETDATGVYLSVIQSINRYEGINIIKGQSGKRGHHH